MRRRRADRAHEYERPSYLELKARLAVNVRRMRKQRDWTQEKAAEHAEMTLQQYQRVELETANATLITLAKLCEGFDIDYAVLLERAAGTGKPRADELPSVLHDPHRPPPYGAKPDKKPKPGAKKK